MDFNGEDDYVDIGIPILPKQDAYAPFPLEFKFSTNSDNHETLFSQYFQYNSNRTEVKIGDTIGKLTFWKYSEGVLLENQFAITDGKWRHMAIVKDSNGNLKLFLDENLEDEGIDNSAYPNYDSAIGRIRKQFIYLVNINVWMKI